MKRLIRKIKQLLTPHYIIIGSHTKEVIGCCNGSKGRAEVLAEEFGATFKRIRKDRCPICKELREASGSIQRS